MNIPFLEQFSRPKGIGGRVAGWVMSKENQKLNRWSIGSLDIQKGDRILEVGYGPGCALESIMNQSVNVRVDGIDASQTMSEVAGERMDHEIECGQARVMIGKIENVYLPENGYDKVLSVNNYTIWGDPDTALKRLFFSLKKGGRIVITMQPREEGASPERTKEMGHLIQTALMEAGFSRISRSYRDLWPERAVCVVAFKE